MMSKLAAARIDTLWGAFIADALAMPVHWFYNPPDIPRLCGGWIRGYIAPPARHPTCILSISSVDSSGRRDGRGGRPVIGDVILHDKLPFWTGGDRSVHYHRGMAAGDSTLNSHCAVRIMDVLASADPDASQPLQPQLEAVFERYVDFMTTPGSHNDTYAESWHRALFRDWAGSESRPRGGPELLRFLEGRAARMEAAAADGQLVVVGALVCALPWVVHRAGRGEDEAAEAARAFVRLTHPAAGLPAFVDLYARSLHRVLNGASVRATARAALTSPELGFTEAQVDGLSRQVAAPKGSEEQLEAFQDVAARLGMACYIKGALSTLFFLAHEFHDDFEAGVLMNVNIGGENCHRGAALGAILGAGSAHQEGNAIPAALRGGLHSIAAEWERVRAKM